MFFCNPRILSIFHTPFCSFILGIPFHSYQCEIDNLWGHTGRGGEGHWPPVSYLSLCFCDWAYSFLLWPQWARQSLFTWLDYWTDIWPQILDLWLINVIMVALIFFLWLRTAVFICCIVTGGISGNWICSGSLTSLIHLGLTPLFSTHTLYPWFIYS